MSKNGGASVNSKQTALLWGAVKSFVAGGTGVIVALNVVDPDKFNVATIGGWKHLGFAVLISAVFGEARFLHQWSTSGGGTDNGVPPPPPPPKP
jgi:hypothetical protein